MDHIDELFATLRNEPPCTRCGENPRRPGQRWCAACHAAYQRKWRLSHPPTKVGEVAVGRVR